jgi:hypothetical protein
MMTRSVNVHLTRLSECSFLRVTAAAGRIACWSSEYSRGELARKAALCNIIQLLWKGGGGVLEETSLNKSGEKIFQKCSSLLNILGALMVT